MLNPELQVLYTYRKQKRITFEYGITFYASLFIEKHEMCQKFKLLKKKVANEVEPF